MRSLVNKTVVRAALICVGLASIVGCSEAEQPIEAESQKQQLGSDTFVDEYGWTWHKIATLDSYYDDLDGEEPSEEEAQAMPTIGEMTIEEIAYEYRPIMEFNYDVYELSEEDAYEMATQMKEAYEAGISPAPADFPLQGEALSESGEATASQEMVLGSDDRSTPQSDTWPEMMNAGTDDDGGRCTAFKMINHHTAITAAHCVYTPDVGWETREDWWFSADDAFTEPLDPGCYSRVVPGGWTRRNHVKFDFAILRFHGNGEWCNFADYNTGFYGYAGVDDEDTHQVSGYPASALGGTYPEYALDRDEAWTNWAYPNRVLHRIDTTGGQSGAAILRGDNGWDDYVHAVGIHKGSTYTPFSRKNHGKRFDGGLISWFRSWSGS